MIRTLFAGLVGYVLIVNWLPNLLPFIASLDRAGFTFGVIAGFVCGLGVIILGYRWIHNSIVEADRRADIAGVHKKHDARRI